MPKARDLQKTYLHDDVDVMLVLVDAMDLGKGWVPNQVMQNRHFPATKHVQACASMCKCPTQTMTLPEPGPMHFDCRKAHTQSDQLQA